MKKIIVLIFLLVGSFCGYGQDLISVTNNTQQSNISFTLKIKVVSVPGCKKQVVIDLGPHLLYERVVGLPEHAFVDPPFPNNSSTITIKNIVATPGSTSSQNISMTLRFKRGTCDNTPSSISAAVSLYDCENAPTSQVEQPVTLNLTAESANGLTTMFSYINDGPVCRGKILRYEIRQRNVSMTGFDLKDVKCFIQIPTCAEFVGVTASGSYSAIPYNYDPITKVVVIEHGDIDLGHEVYANLYIKYPCDTPACIGNPVISYYSKGTGCDIEYVLGTQAYTSEVVTSCSQSYCGPGGGNGPTVGYSINDGEYTCPLSTSCISKTEDITYTINVPHQYTFPSQGIVFSTKIDDWIEIHKTSMTIGNTNETVSCAPIVEFYYDGAWNNITPSITNNNYVWSNTTTSHVSEIRYSFACNIFSPSMFAIYQSHKWRPITPPANNIIYFPAKLESGGQTLYSTYSEGNSANIAYSKLIQECRTNFSVSMFVKSDTEASYTSLIEAVPGETVTYWMGMTNKGGNTGPFVIETFLDAHLTNIKNLRYSVAGTNFTPVLPDQTEFTITDPGYGTASVVIESEDNRTRLKISGFTIPIPCDSQKSIYFLFDADVKAGLSQGQYINNNFIIKENNLVTVTSETSTVVIGSQEKISAEMYARCASSGAWLATGINGKNGETVAYKMVTINEGTVPVKISELLNLKPQNGDFFEIDSQASRGSTLKVNYNCDLLPIAYSSTGGLPIAIFTYSQEGFNMTRDMICPPGPSGPAPVFGPACNESSNWLRVQFPGGYEIAPGESISVEFYGKVSGSSGTANNSFTYKVLNCSFISNLSESVKLINDGNTCMIPLPCEDCASFDLVKLENYLVSAWVKESDPNNPLVQYQNYEQAYISIAFKDDTDVLIDEELRFLASGEIIDGWQRIIGQFRVPATAHDMFLKLANNSPTMAYFDDIRVMPSKSNMKSFVYDQKTQRLMAELDENNYSTFYEYDLEGGLIRIKKETEKGIFTIQETRSSNKK